MQFQFLDVCHHLTDGGFHFGLAMTGKVGALLIHKLFKALQFIGPTCRYFFRTPWVSAKDIAELIGLDLSKVLIIESTEF